MPFRQPISQMLMDLSVNWSADHPLYDKYNLLRSNSIAIQQFDNLSSGL
jgi:hypothetical protein